MPLPNYCMITASYPPVMGGVERHVYELHQTLTSRGLKGRILVLGHPPESGILEDIHYIRKPRQQWMRTKRAVLKAVGRDPYVQAVVNYLQHNNSAIFHFHDYYTLHPFISALKKAGLLGRVFLTFHGWEGHYPPKKKVVKERQYCAKSAVANIAVGDFIPAWYSTESDKITYGAVNVTQFHPLPLIPIEPLRLLYLGQFREDTGILTMLAALDLVLEHCGKETFLHAYGSGVLAPILQKHDLVIVHDSVEVVAPLLIDFPIVIASGYLSILEALYSRRVVFAIYENAGRESYLRLHPMADILFLCADANDMEQALQTCIKDWNVVLKRFEVAWDWAKDQTWSNMADLYVDLWAERNDVE